MRRSYFALADRESLQEKRLRHGVAASGLSVSTLTGCDSAVLPTVVVVRQCESCRSIFARKKWYNCSRLYGERE